MSGQPHHQRRQRTSKNDCPPVVSLPWCR
jgi:hypothetical protein